MNVSAHCYDKQTFGLFFTTAPLEKENWGRAETLLGCKIEHENAVAFQCTGFGAFAGFILCVPGERFLEKKEHAPGTWSLLGLYVEKRFRRMGVARALTERALAALLQKGACSLSCCLPPELEGCRKLFQNSRPAGVFQGNAVYDVEIQKV